MNLSLIVENVEVDLSNLTKEVKEKVLFKVDNCLGIWYVKGRNLNECEVNLWDKLEDYLTVKLKSLEYCKNQPHRLTAFM